MRLTKPSDRVRCAHAESIGYRRTMGGRRTALALRVAQTQGRQASRARPSGIHRYSVRVEDRHPLGDAPSGNGLWIGHDLLATPQGVARSGRVESPPPNSFELPGQEEPHRMVAGVVGLGKRAGSRGGEKVGPNPTDRGKRGSKRHLVVDGAGIPLAVAHTAANVHDSKMLEELVDAIRPICGPRGRAGRPRKRPKKLHADKGYDFRRCREALRKRSIKIRIGRRRVDSSERLGQYRWVVERTLSWLNRYRRLKVRYERRADVHQAFLDLGCALICWNHMQRCR
jgi:transposase